MMTYCWLCPSEVEIIGHLIAIGGDQLRFHILSSMVKCHTSGIEERYK